LFAHSLENFFFLLKWKSPFSPFFSRARYEIGFRQQRKEAGRKEDKDQHWPPSLATGCPFLESLSSILEMSRVLASSLATNKPF